MKQKRAGLGRIPTGAIGALATALVMIVGLVALSAGLFDTTPERLAVGEIVEAISAESTDLTANYLAGPESAAHIVASAVERDTDPEGLEHLISDLTMSQPQIAGTFIGYPDGRFLDARTIEDEEIRIKSIEVDGNQRTVGVEVVDLDRTVTNSYSLPNDTYDPTTRPWYSGAIDGDVHWTDPYTFFTSREAGITYSVAVLDARGNLNAVVGVDIQLDELERFLEQRRPSENGGAAVVNEDGNLIAGSSKFLQTSAWQSDVRLRLSESDGSMSTFSHDSNHLLSVASIGQDVPRFLVIDAPTSDFLEELRSDREDFATLAAILGVVGIVFLSIGALIVSRFLANLERLAATDPLTGLLNRSGIDAYIDLNSSKPAPAAAMTLDVDDFKQINDQYGHVAGDQVLKEVAKRLAAAAPSSAVIGRLGGDEFCVLLLDEDDPHDVLSSIVHSADGTIETPEHRLNVALSAGFAVSGSEMTDRAGLLRQSDVAMYHSKSHAGTAVVAFEPSMTLPWESEAERRELLTAAVHSGAIQVVFQPQFDLATGLVVGAEARFRWEGRAEEDALIGDLVDELDHFDLLGNLVPAMLAEAKHVQRSLAALRPFSVCLPATSRELVSPELVKFLQRNTAEAQYHWAVVVPEQKLANADQHGKYMLSQIRRMGVDVVLEGFGVGKRSLDVLHAGLVDVFKLAPVFSADLGRGETTTPLAAAFITLGKALGLRVVAEGIERHEQRSALTGLGCRYGEGPYLGDACNAQDFVRLWASSGVSQAA